MLVDFAYQLIYGKPLIMYVGLLTFVVLLLQVAMGYVIYHKIFKIDIKWHLFNAALLVILAIFHAILGMSLYYKF